MHVLVLSGGGAKGAYQVGALDALLKSESFDAIVGVSVGALNAAGFSYLGIEKLKEVWFSLKSQSDIVSANSLFSILFLKKRGYYSLDPCRKLLEKTLPSGIKPSIPTYFGFVDLRDTKINYFPAVDDMRATINAILASSAMPAIMEAVDYDFVDGGLRDIIPLGFAVKNLKADKVTVLSASPYGREILGPYSAGSLKIVGHAMRAIDIMCSEIMYNDLRLCHARNSLEGFRRVSVKVYAPRYPSVIDTLQFEPKAIRAAYDLGFQMAQNPVMAFE